MVRIHLAEFLVAVDERLTKTMWKPLSIKRKGFRNIERGKCPTRLLGRNIASNQTSSYR